LQNVNLVVLPTQVLPNLEYPGLHWQLGTPPLKTHAELLTHWRVHAPVCGCAEPTENITNQHVTQKKTALSPFLNPLKHRKATTVALTLSSHNFPTDRSRELFKASKEAENLLGSI